jgi:hypothetical protein
MLIAGIQPTGEQLAVIDTCVADANVVIEAGAGTGKTSTLCMAAFAMEGRRGVYLAYTKATALAARRTFPSWVACVNAHSIAYRAIGYRYGQRLPGNTRRMPSWQVARELGIEEPLVIGPTLLLTPAHLARIVMGTLERFCHSADLQVSADHIPGVRGLDAAAFAELTWRIVPLARRAWLDVQRPDGRLEIRHDHYLKMWQLGGAVIDADFVMFDEAQDANPVIAAIVQSQPHSQKIVVGDSCQAIYGWRGAIDAMEDWPCDARLNLRQSFRFGEPVAEEANKWLTTLRAPYRLSGASFISSAVGTVTDPQVVICRTNAEAFVQARAALQAGRRVALGGGAADLKALAGAALDLQAAGSTNYAELAAFRAWGAVQNYIRTDAAGADLAAGVRLIDKYGASAILATIDKLSREDRAEITACTVHAAKGREWGRVLIASDFPDLSNKAIPRQEAMTAYVAVTRARSRLDPAGLAWIDNHSAARPGREAKVKNQVQTADDPLAPDNSVPPRPYAGGRAQAESGGRVIAADYAAWTTVTATPSDHPRVRQLAAAWRSVTKRDLDDDLAPAGIRYRILSHAASALAATPELHDRDREQAILTRLATHARLHGDRLRATADLLFTRSSRSGPYAGEQGGGSRVIENDYRTWTRTRGASSSNSGRLGQAWVAIRSCGLADGPAPAADRYTELADAAAEVADDWSPDLPSTALGPLLDLADHARKHAVRLRATADALQDTKLTESDREMAALAERFESPPISEIARQAHSQETRADGTEDGGTRRSRREARVHRYARNKDERDR